MTTTLNARFAHQLEIMQAIADGKKVQSRPKKATTWNNWPGPTEEYQVMNFTNFDFRIAPPPPRVYYAILRNTGENVSSFTDQAQAERKLGYHNSAEGLKCYQPYSLVKLVEEINS